MRLKSLMTIAASLFVAAGIIALTFRAYRPEPSTEAAQQRGAAQIDISRTERIAAYYFHRTERPSTCTATESIVKAAIESTFPEQLKDGRLNWCSVNYEEPGNEHYASDYKLTAPCLVLARIKGGKTSGMAKPVGGPRACRQQARLGPACPKERAGIPRLHCDPGCLLPVVAIALQAVTEMNDRWN